MKYGWLFVMPHCVSGSCRARTIFTAFSSAFTPMASPGPPGLIAAARLPQCVLLPSTWMRKYQLPAAIGETVSGFGTEVGSVTTAAAAPKPARGDAAVPRPRCRRPREPRGGVRPLLAGGADAVEPPVADLGVPWAAVHPVLGIDRGHGVDVA